MIKNNKGITLVELIISIALISIVIMFLFRLLTDVRYNNNNVDYNRENQQTRALILKMVQKDFLEKKLIGLRETTANSNEFEMEFRYGDSTTAKLSIAIDPANNKQYVSYRHTINGITETEKWWVEKENESSKFNVNCITYNHNNLFNDVGGEFFYLKINIPMVVNKDNKNAIDDLELFYMGKREEITNVAVSFFDFNRANSQYYIASTC